MKETVIHKREMIGRDDNGHLVRATAKLYSLGDQAPYFSFTTDNGALLDKIREAFPEVAHFVNLHLCQTDGTPMHCEANALYYAKKADKVALARHLGIRQDQAQNLIGAVLCAEPGDDRKRVINQACAGLAASWEIAALACIDWLKADATEGDYMTDGALQWDDDLPAIHFDGDTLNLDNYFENGEDGIHVTWNGGDWYVFPNEDIAGQAARDYWEDMAHNDKAEFRAIVGEDALIAWCLGESYAVGTKAVSSLDSWLDLWLTTPEEHWASYDCEQREGYINKAFADEFGFDWGSRKDDEWLPIVLYRC